MTEVLSSKNPASDQAEPVSRSSSMSQSSKTSKDAKTAVKKSLSHTSKEDEVDPAAMVEEVQRLLAAVSKEGRSERNQSSVKEAMIAGDKRTFNMKDRDVKLLRAMEDEEAIALEAEKKYPRVKDSRAGIALTRTTSGNNLLSVTLVTGPPNDGVFADPTEHNLQDQTPEALANLLSHILTAPTSIALSLPVSLPDDKQKQYRDTLREILPDMETWYAMDHSTAYLNHIYNEFTHKDQEQLVLFLDLTTPNQAAAKLISVETYDGCAYFSPETRTVAELDKLVKATIKEAKSLHAIYILCGEDVGLGLEALTTKFPEASVRFVTPAEISRGAAASRERHEGVITTQIMCAFFTPVPIRVALADGRKVQCVPRSHSMPLERTVLFTTARENQRTATLEFLFGDEPIGKVVIQGLVASRPRIRVSVSCDDEGATSVRVVEVGCESNEVVASLSEPKISKEEIEAYVNAHPQASEYGVAGEVLGELPEC